MADPRPAEKPGLIRVGLVSDTHRRIDPRIAVALDGVDAILCAGDVVVHRDLAELELIAPVTIARGNNDATLCSGRVADVARTTIAGVRFLIVHDLYTLYPRPDDVDVIVYGHTHIPRAEWHGRVFVVNPGSASQPRRGSPASVSIIEIAAGGAFEHRPIPLDTVK